MAKDKPDTIDSSQDTAGSISSEVSFERLSLKDEEDYIDFLADAYRDQFNFYKYADRSLVKNCWRWEYIDNPAVPVGDPLIWICRFKKKIIAQICFMPSIVKVKDKTYKGGWCQDFIILPQFRNMGMGHFLIRYALKELAGCMDILMASGTNAASYALLKNYGFINLGFIDRNIRPALFEFSRSVYKTDRIEISEENVFNYEFDRFWFDVSKKISCIIKRDAKMLEWRFIKNPYLCYKVITARCEGALKGYVICRQGRLARGGLAGLNIGIISDILVDPHDKTTGVALLRAAFYHLKKKSIIFRCDVLCKEMGPILKAAGLINIRSSSRFLIYPINGDIDEIVKDSDTWYVTYGDSDMDFY